MTTALIADDEPQLALYLRDQLQRLWPSLQVVSLARHGQEAAAEIARLQPDLAFLDIRMPGLTGLEVAQGIEGVTRVVFVTAYDDFAVQAFEQEALDYVLKPVTESRLRRTVEMYQWVEHRETRTSSNTGGSQTRTTRIRYERAWRAEAVDSSQFDQPRDHANPPLPTRSHTFDARAVTVGVRSLTPSLITQIEGFRPLPVQPAQSPALAALGRPVRAHESGLYVGADPVSPVIGDLRVRWEVAPAAPVTVLAAQQGNTFADWRTPSGRTLEQNLEMGAVSAAQMFTNLETGNVVLTWVLRFVGWLLMFAGISMVTRPLVVVADVLPFLGSLVGAGSGLFAFLVSAPLSLLTVAMGWIAYRPLLGAGLLALGVGIAVVFGKLAAAKGATQNAQRQAQRQAGYAG